MAAWLGGRFGGEWIHVDMAVSLCCLPETIIALLVSYTPKQKVKKINSKILKKIWSCSNASIMIITLKHFLFLKYHQFYFKAFLKCRLIFKFFIEFVTILLLF